MHPFHNAHTHPLSQPFMLYSFKCPNHCNNVFFLLFLSSFTPHCLCTLLVLSLFLSLLQHLHSFYALSLSRLLKLSDSFHSLPHQTTILAHNTSELFKFSTLSISIPFKHILQSIHLLLLHTFAFLYIHLQNTTSYNSKYTSLLFSTFTFKIPVLTTPNSFTSLRNYTSLSPQANTHTNYHYWWPRYLNARERDAGNLHKQHI